MYAMAVAFVSYVFVYFSESSLYIRTKCEVVSSESETCKQLIYFYDKKI